MGPELHGNNLPSTSAAEEMRSKERGRSVPVEVEAYSGYRADERPVAFVFEGASYRITHIIARWYDPDAEYFRIRTSDGHRFLLRCGRDGWTLEGEPSG